jgi:hypothetical protein
LFIHLFICVCIVWAISPPCLPPLPQTPTPLTSRQNLFCPFLQFCWRENIRDNKKDIAFLLVDITIATQRFLALLPCTCVLQPKLVPLYLTSSLLPGHLPIVTSASLRLLYLFLYNELLIFPRMLLRVWRAIIPIYHWRNSIVTLENPLKLT